MKTNVINRNFGINRCSLVQNLFDAGCDTDAIQRYTQLQKEGKMREQLRLLAQQRRNLLHVIRENQKRLDCLDYLIHCIETDDPSTSQEKQS